jgi:N-acyl-D-aspartate/D-glutamate deacylase
MKPSSLPLLLVIILAACTMKTQPKKVDILLSGGTVFTGDNLALIKTDVGITGDRIVYVGNDYTGEAGKTIDVSGLVVSPGFIDMHTHLGPLMKIPDATSHLMQGVTTALGGPDGGGPWPFESYLDSLEKMQLGMNVAYLVGHNSIRKAVMNMDNRSPTDEELASMKSYVQRAMAAGAFGISTGLKYLPGTFSETSELIELSKVAAANGGIYTSHLREEGLGLLAGVTEAIEIGRRANIPIILTHHKAIGMPVWGKSKITLAMVDSARAAGIDVMMDQYPYTASYTGLSVLIPAWAQAGGQAEFIKRTKSPVLRDSILAGIEFNILNDRGGGDLRRVQLALTPWDQSLSGKTLYDWAVQRGMEANEKSGALLVLEAQQSGGGTAIYHAMDENDVERIMQHPMTMIGSDGRLTNINEGWPHPRWYGTFPRVLGKYVREKKVLNLPTALNKMTAMPADRLDLAYRGRIKVGHIADITIFNASTIKDNSKFTDPHHYPTGIEYVLVNGVLAVNDGEITHNRAGKLLRKTRPEIKLAE